MFDIREYEAMAMIELPDDERGRISVRFCVLADSFNELEQIDAGGVLPLVTVLDEYNVLREDIAEKSITREELLANAPEHYDGYFKVPGTLE